MLFSETELDCYPTPLRQAITAAYRTDEANHVNMLLQQISFSPAALQRIENLARQLVIEVRKQRVGKGGIDAFLYQYNLSTEEGIALMCLAEALLRIPDEHTANRLIKDKITNADWQAHVGQSDSMFVNAATWGFMLTGKVLATPPEDSEGLRQAFQRLLNRSGEPIIRKAIGQAMKILGRQFVMGQTIGEALKRAEPDYRYSFDMLGEAARTAEDAERYFEAYQKAIAAVGADAAGKGFWVSNGISVKLSALHPRYELAKRERVLVELMPRLRTLAIQAKAQNIGLTVDAEEADRLELSLDIFEAVFSDPALQGYEGFGLAVQSYQKRAWYVIDWLADLAKRYQRKMTIRLIKGAYWDTEIKVSQVFGYEDYPVFTRKNSTDVSFLACARKILNHPQAFHAQFATHNAHTVAAVLEMAGDRRDFEFQCLYGMGHTLYDQVVGKRKLNLPCRVYAPVGGHEDLLAYLVRRLLENGANSSFVNRIIDEKVSVEEIIAHPTEKSLRQKQKRHQGIPLPIDLFGQERKNSRGLDLSNMNNLTELKVALTQAAEQNWAASPIINGVAVAVASKPVLSPIDHRQVVGTVGQATAEHAQEAIGVAAAAAFAWDATPVTKRAAILERAGELLEEHRAELIYLLNREAGKAIPDCISEVREAVDFCRYYAAQAREKMQPEQLPGPTGEANSMCLHGRGVIACISPWNFPLAIFLGQITAALATGNTVIAKPAKQTMLVAAHAVRLLHQAGVPGNVLQFLPGSSAVIGSYLLQDERIKGVVMTGSTETAQAMNQTLAARSGAIIPLIAETGGMNAMIVDSSALCEQVVADVLMSAFNSAGQRCSALRFLYVQEEIADKFLTMLKGAMAELVVGDPSNLKTDIGPVIDQEAKATLVAHAERMRQEGKLVYEVPLTEEAAHGTFFAPCAFEINSIKQLQREVFGPILHVIRYSAKQLDQVLADINGTGYGLTLGIHSRISETIQYILQHMHVGNAYVNRNMVGAVVGVQPFGGEGLSGTGPKAGGPWYLARFCTERTTCVNTTATGGNTALMSLPEEL